MVNSTPEDAGKMFNLKLLKVVTAEVPIVCTELSYPSFYDCYTLIHHYKV